MLFDALPVRARPLGKALDTGVAGVTWAGGRFYDAEGFAREAAELRISKRVPWHLPRWLEIGKT
jgi:hypothetical protein